MEIYVARQPIFNKNRKVYGYELLFRESMANYFPDIDGNTASSKLLSNSFFSIGIENITGNSIAFINFTKDLILSRVPMLFPNNKIVVEILEDVEPEDEVISACKDMAKKGYHIALDDFFYTPELEPLVALANTIKFDLLVTPLEDISEIAKELSKNGINLLAEKVETHQEFEKALEMGFKYFQGYFFSKPEILKGKEIPPLQMNMLEVMAEANKQGFRFDRLEKMILRDVSMSYKLLRLVNSAYFRRVNEISSIRQAIVNIGEKGIRRFISIITMAGLAADKPHELIRSSVIRARFCELLGDMNGSGVDTSELFTMGLFSLIDAIMDDSMANIMAKLPLTDAIKWALIKREGQLHDYLRLAVSYEKGEWEQVFQMAKTLGIDDEALPSHYIEALGWADSFTAL